jgi:hypothetical protein
VHKSVSPKKSGGNVDTKVKSGKRRKRQAGVDKGEYHPTNIWGK